MFRIWVNKTTIEQNRRDNGDRPTVVVRNMEESSEKLVKRVHILGPSVVRYEAGFTFIETDSNIWTY